MKNVPSKIGWCSLLRIILIPSLDQAIFTIDRFIGSRGSPWGACLRCTQRNDQKSIDCSANLCAGCAYARMFTLVPRHSPARCRKH